MNYSQQQQYPWKLTYSAVSGQYVKQTAWLIDLLLLPALQQQQQQVGYVKTVIKFYDRPTIDVRLVMGYSDCFEWIFKDSIELEYNENFFEN